MSCLKMIDAKQSILLNEDPIEYINSTEFDCMKIITTWLKQAKSKCSFCGYNYLQVCNIEVDNVMLYDFDKISSYYKAMQGELFIWSIVRKKEGIEMNLSGKFPHDRQFLKQCLDIDSYRYNW